MPGRGTLADARAARCGGLWLVGRPRRALTGLLDWPAEPPPANGRTVRRAGEIGIAAGQHGVAYILSQFLYFTVKWLLVLKNG